MFVAICYVRSNALVTFVAMGRTREEKGAVLWTGVDSHCSLGVPERFGHSG